MRRARRTAALVVLGILGGTLASGCGVPTSRTALSLPANDRVVAGSTTTPSTTTTTTLATKTSRQTTVYFFRSDHRLTGVHRSWIGKVTPDAALFLLEEGPYASEKNLTTYVPPAPNAPSEKQSVVMHNGIAEVPLDGNAYSTLYATELSNALGQIVVTLMMNFPAIKGINFTLRTAGFASVPFNYTPAGTTVATPVTIQTYASLLPPVKPSSTTKAPASKKK